MKTIKRWLEKRTKKTKSTTYSEAFTPEMTTRAVHYWVERDGLYPGYWHVRVDRDHEYRVQTDEWIENGRVDWAVCNCPVGKRSGQMSRCSHVAAVLLRMVAESYSG